MGEVGVKFSVASPLRRRLLLFQEEPLETPACTSGGVLPGPETAPPEEECAAGRLDETSLHAVFQQLMDPNDLKAIMGVCRDWRRIVLEGHSWRSLCNRLVGAHSPPFACARLSDTFRTPSGSPQARGRLAGHSSDAPGGSLHATAWLIGQSSDVQEGILFRRLCEVLSQGGGSENLIVDAIAASSTDNYPEECVSKTLKEHARERTGNFLQACYWSSKGDSYANKDECLLYKLMDPMCVVSSFLVRPFKAFFQPKQPVYSSAHIRFKIGHRVAPEPRPEPAPSDAPKSGGYLDSHAHGKRRDKYREADYVWTYESPRFCMDQEDTLQRFDLPAPVLCSNDVLKVELLGKVQRQEDYDNLYYTCITYVKAVGVSLPHFQCKSAEGGNILEYHGESSAACAMDVDSHADGLDTALFVAELDSDDEELEEDIWD